MATLIVPPTDSPDNLKRCTKCGKEYPATTQYFRQKHAQLIPNCKSCDREYRVAHAEHIRQRDREYRSSNTEAIRAQKREYRAANLEKQREYRAANAERAREYAREYYAVNAEHIAERMRNYRRTPAGKAVSTINHHRRRAREIGNGGTYTADDLASIRAAQTDTRGRLICWNCGKPIKGTPHLDHWIPLKHGGRNSAGNLHYMHARCNQSKGAKHPFELGILL